MMGTQHYATIDEYIAVQPPSVRPLMEKMRSVIHAAAPESEETFGYGVPAFRQKGVLVYFAAFKNHIGFYPTASGIKAFAKDLASYDTSEGTVRFPLDKAMPYDLVTKMVKFRVKENLHKAVLKKSSQVASKTKAARTAVKRGQDSKRSGKNNKAMAKKY